MLEGFGAGADDTVGAGTLTGRGATATGDGSTATVGRGAGVGIGAAVGGAVEVESAVVGDVGSEDVSTEGVGAGAREGVGASASEGDGDGAEVDGGAVAAAISVPALGQTTTGMSDGGAYVLPTHQPSVNVTTIAPATTSPWTAAPRRGAGSSNVGNVGI